MKPAKARVYFNEYNVLMENSTYLPLVSGLLQSYAQTSPEIIDHYEFMPFMFCREPVERILACYDNPAVAAFSVFMWNEQLSLKIAERVKERYPGCLVVFGGQQVPYDNDEYLERYPFIDAIVRGEGEQPFAAILRKLMEAPLFEGVPGVSWRDPDTGRIVRNPAAVAPLQELDTLPSPYLNGLFDQLLERHPQVNFQAIIQSNRGCPFTCAYCSWHKSSKMRYFDLQRVASEVDWCGSRRIAYVFNADSNFGIHERDLEIARILAATKERYGYPEKFRSCFTKNADDRIYDLSMQLLSSKLEKGITLSFQSLSDVALQNIKRKNIRLSTYRNLLDRFNAVDVPIYTELILGLPGETAQSWLAGIDNILQSGLKGQLFIYPCEVYPNSEMGDAAYLERFGIVTRRILLTEIHGAVREEGLLPEYQEIIVATDSMPIEDWRRMMIVSWLIMTLFSLKLAFFFLSWLRNRFNVSAMDFVQYLLQAEQATAIQNEISFYHSHLDAFLDGTAGRGVVMPEYGTIYWDVEEASFLRLAANKETFYRELAVVSREYLDIHGIACDPEELEEAVMYQQLHIPTPCNPVSGIFRFSRNFPEYFARLASSADAPLEKRSQLLELEGTDFNNDKSRFARETVLWGRKSDNICNRSRWFAGDGNE